MKVCAIIQARLNSTRLPGKVLLPLAGKSMLQNIVERVKRAGLVDEIRVATPGIIYESLIWDICRELDGVRFCAPLDIPENDLVGRYLRTAEIMEADFIIRVCSDNPCISGEAIDRLIAHAIQSQPGGVLFTNAGDLKGSQWPNGIGAEFYTMKMLEWMNETIHRPDLREHPHMYWHTMGYAVEPPCPEKWKRPDIRLDVNTQEDYERIKEIYDHFGNNEFTTGQVLEYLDGKKDLAERNISTGE